MLQVTFSDGMVAEEAVPHIQKLWQLTKLNKRVGGSRDISLHGSRKAGGQRSVQGNYWVPQQAQPGLLAFILDTTTSEAKSSASLVMGKVTIHWQQHGLGEYLSVGFIKASNSVSGDPLFYKKKSKSLRVGQERVKKIYWISETFNKLGQISSFIMKGVFFSVKSVCAAAQCYCNLYHYMLMSLCCNFMAYLFCQISFSG